MAEEEERIIDSLLLSNSNKLYDDLDFLPTRTSLYLSEKQIPEYDDEVFQHIQ
jgi:fructose-1,6-bisphosphatase